MISYWIVVGIILFKWSITYHIYIYIYIYMISYWIVVGITLFKLSRLHLFASRWFQVLSSNINNSLWYNALYKNILIFGLLYIYLIFSRAPMLYIYIYIVNNFLSIQKNCNKYSTPITRARQNLNQSSATYSYPRMPHYFKVSVSLFIGISTFLGYLMPKPFS